MDLHGTPIYRWKNENTFFHRPRLHGERGRQDTLTYNHVDKKGGTMD